MWHTFVYYASIIQILVPASMLFDIVKLQVKYTAAAALTYLWHVAINTTSNYLLSLQVNLFSVFL